MVFSLINLTKTTPYFRTLLTGWLDSSILELRMKRTCHKLYYISILMTIAKEFIIIDYIRLVYSTPCPIEIGETRVSQFCFVIQKKKDHKKIIFSPYLTIKWFKDLDCLWKKNKMKKIYTGRKGLQTEGVSYPKKYIYWNKYNLYFFLKFFKFSLYCERYGIAHCCVTIQQSCYNLS